MQKLYERIKTHDLEFDDFRSSGEPVFLTSDSGRRKYFDFISF